VLVRRSCLLSILAGTALAGCSFGSGDSPITSPTRPLAAFDQLQVARGVEVSLHCGGLPSAILHGEADDLADTELSVEGGILTVRRNSLDGGYHGGVHVDVTVANPLIRVVASSGATLEAPACAVSRDRLELDSSSGAAIRLAADARRLTVAAGSGSTIHPLRDARLDAREARIEAAGGASVRVCAVGDLDASASSGGSITAESISSGGGGVSLGKCE
jgi:hypothetical protein